MKQINSLNIRRLREQQNFTLDELAAKARLDRGTINKIENGKRPVSRPSTIRKLAAALNVSEEALTGPDIDEIDRRPLLAKRTQMNIKMAVDARNSLALVALRYKVKPSQILHLAPFLFYWAAEESLNRRKSKLNEITEKMEAISSIGRPVHLSEKAILNWEGEDILDEELRSIANRDLFGLQISDDNVCHNYEDSEQNPFAIFLRSVADSLGDNVDFEYWSPRWGQPGYTLGKEEALNLVGGDEEAANHIVRGNVPLHELPKDVRERGSPAIAQWAKDTGSRMLSELIEFDQKNWGTGVYDD